MLATREARAAWLASAADGDHAVSEEKDLMRAKSCGYGVRRRNVRQDWEADL